jgi:DNA-binding response OmpR family regulator
VRVLVIDDEPGYRELLAREFDRLGLAVDTADDGVDGVARASERDYDLAVVDLTMPRLGGLEVLDELKKARPRMPVLLITGFASVETAVYAMRHGAADVVLKPFDLEPFLSRVKTLLEVPCHAR